MDSMKSSKKFTKTQTKIIILLISLTISALVILSLLLSKCNFFPLSRNPSPSFINNACSRTLYESLCISTLSTIPPSKNSTAILQFPINQTLAQVKTATTAIDDRFAHDQDLEVREKNAIGDCMELLDQTLYELQSAMDELGSPLTSSYANIKTLLSAAMTNHYTCINGFLDLEQLDSAIDEREGRRNAQLLQNLLTSVNHVISNTLALIKHVENQETTKKVKMATMKIIKRDYARRVRRKKIKVKNLSPNSIVARDGGGDFVTIGKAISSAPNFSKKTYVIKINAGIYKENVVIPREKMNIMLIGDGMNSTIITSSRNLADGFSTFNSATLSFMLFSIIRFIFFLKD